MRLLCLYQVLFQYRVGTYKAISKLPGVDFELWHGKDMINTKVKNYRGDVSFKHRLIPNWRIPVKTNNGSSAQPFFPFLFTRLVLHNPDVIFAEGASSLFSLSTAYLYIRLFRKKLILWSMGALAGREYKGVRGLVQRWIRHVERRADAIFAYSTQAEEYFIREGVKCERIFKAINVIDTETKLVEIEANGPVEKEPGFNVAFVGAINKTKRLELLVDAIGILSKKYEDVSLHIIGDGDYIAVIRAYVEKKGLGNKVIFYGRVTDGLNVLLSRYQVLALPGLGGLAIVDGMISSLPIVSGLADGTEKDLIDEKNGFVTDNMTKEYMVDKLTLLYENPVLLKQMGENSFKKITNEFSFNSYIDIFQKCLDFVNDEK